MSEISTETRGTTATAADCVREVSRLLRQLEGAGLLYDPVRRFTAEAVEHVLMMDEWECKTCGMTQLRTCPETGKPHRRRLVRVAQEILRHIGSKTGQLVVRPPKMLASMGGKSRLRSLRRIPMNPQALLLAYYYVVLPDGEVDRIVSECALQLVELLEQLKLYGAQEPVDEQYAIALLSSISVTWQEYVNKMAEDLHSLTIADRNTCQEVLVNGTKTAYVAAACELKKTPLNKDLENFVNLLRQRLARLVSREDLKELEAGVREKQQNIEEQEERLKRARKEVDGNLKSLNFQLVAPPLLSETNTSGSETEHVPILAMGPAIPPDWYVDEQGRSRPPVVNAAQRRREEYIRLEFRAKKAYETVIKIPEQKNDFLKDQIISSLKEAQLDLLAQQCNLHPPDLRGVRYFLNLVIEGLLNVLPRRFRAQAEQEVRDVLDWRIVRRSVMGSPGNIASLMRYVMGKIAEFGAPAKAEEIIGLAEEMSKNLETCTPDLGTAVANAFRLMLSSIHQLHEDIVKYSLLYISQELRDNSVPFIREFISTCHAKVDQWESSVAFVRNYFNEERIKEWASSPAAASATALTEKERRLRGSLLYGFVDLLRSSRVQAGERWHDYPTECFYFEKAVVFYATNAVQENTLLLILTGTISTVLRGRGVDSRVVSDILKQLHDGLLKLFSEQLTLPYLKSSLTKLIDEELPRKNISSPLTEGEIAQLHGTVEKMTDTSGTLYVAFEKRVLSFIESSVAHNQRDQAPLGLVTDSLSRLSALLQRALAFNWEVYQPFYKEMLVLFFQDNPDK